MLILKDVILNELKAIFKYYKKEYKLKTKLIFNNNDECFFNHKTSIISLDIDYTEGHNTISVLLHEIGHAIDWKNNKKQFKKEIRENFGRILLSRLDYWQWKALPFEKRANKFAEKETEKWTT